MNMAPSRTDEKGNYRLYDYGTTFEIEKIMPLIYNDIILQIVRKKPKKGQDQGVNIKHGLIVLGTHGYLQEPSLRQLPQFSDVIVQLGVKSALYKRTHG
jgi:hypothetical protein